MRENLGATRYINTIKMQRQTFSGVFIAVEGSTDKKFYSRFFKQGDSCRVILTSGKPSSKKIVIEVVTNLSAEIDFKGILGIVDADFEHVSPSDLISSAKNIFLTDAHDLESMLINSPAFKKLLHQLCSEDKFPSNPKEILISACLDLGYLRWISQEKSWNLKFEGLNFSKFIDKSSLTCNSHKMIAEVLNKTQGENSSPERILEIQGVVDKKRIEQHPPLQICCGHDLIEALSLAFKKAWASHSNSADSASVKIVDLENCLQLSYESIFWKETQLFKDLKAWEMENTGYIFLED